MKNIPIDNRDADIVIKMLVERHRDSGYQGPVCISITRLAEIHMPGAEATTKAAISKAKEISR
jgi:hypothetical protein